MKSKLDKMLAQLDPSEIFDPYENGMQYCIDNLHIERATVNSYDEFRVVICRLYSLSYIVSVSVNKWLDSGRPIDWGPLVKDYLPYYITGTEHDVFDLFCKKCEQVLDTMYGNYGWLTAFDRARTGLNGGLVGIIREFAAKLLENNIAKTIHSRVDYIYYEYESSEIFQAAYEFKQKFPHLVPHEYRDRHKDIFAMNFKDVLYAYPVAMQKLRQINTVS